MGASNMKILAEDQESVKPAESHQLVQRFSILSTLALGFISPWNPQFWSDESDFEISAAGLAELASAFPSSGGQYHFAYMVASPQYRSLVAFVIGWLSIAAWCLTSASTAIVCGKTSNRKQQRTEILANFLCHTLAQMAGSLASIYHPQYAAEAWHTYLIYLLIMILATAIVCFSPNAIPRGEVVLLWCSVAGFVASLVVVLATQRHPQSAQAVFTEYKNESGWNDGTSFIVGLGTCMYAYLAIDGATHIAEEVPCPSRSVPKAMGMTMLIGMLTVIPWTVAFLFTLTDVDKVISSAIPIHTVYSQATNSETAATILTVWILFIYSGALVSCIVTTGRLTYAFSRDGGLPFSSFFSRVDSRNQVPINATLACFGFVSIYGLIYIGSTTAFNSFISMSIMSLNITYVVPQAIAVYRGRDRVLPERPFRLGRCVGTFCNWFSTLWVAFISLMFCFPATNPTTVGSMNYVSVVLVGISVVILALWYGGKRKIFVGPTSEAV
ncbi:amino acid permease [Penicillium verhagenii]|uniref:amino acid permease n=1 Tax=Penicillium verhagenii TaxID=1562060 RepID=UPI002545A771|nr:amino acid permease [Penicillium verhagenii]KAJ5927793.1 amino acid permease [Penicillium verhagenii]